MLEITPEILSHLEKESSQREKRNEERRQRREKGKGGDKISDDEEDVVLSLMKGNVGKGKDIDRDTPKDSDVPTLATRTPSGTTSHPLETSLPRERREDIIFTDEDADGHEFSMHDDSIPNSIIMLAKCHRTPPLSLFLGESLDRIKAGRDVKYIKVGTGEFANTKLLDVSIFPSDVSLDKTQWIQAYNTFLAFVAKSMGERLYQGFLSHWDSMMKDQKFAHYFEAYRTFDEKIRQSFFTTPFITDPTSIQYNSALQEAKLFLSVSPSNSLSDNRQSLPGCFPTRWQPYGPGPQRSFRANYKMCCLCCGIEGHRADTCKAEGPSKTGRSFVVRAVGRGLERLSDARPVCIRFNLGNCVVSDPSHPLHICSLCSDTHHGASGCTRN
jgi:hypothetical protein